MSWIHSSLVDNSGQERVWEKYRPQWCKPLVSYLMVTFRKPQEKPMKLHFMGIIFMDYFTLAETIDCLEVDVATMMSLTGLWATCLKPRVWHFSVAILVFLEPDVTTPASACPTAPLCSHSHWEQVTLVYYLFWQPLLKGAVCCS